MSATLKLTERLHCRGPLCIGLDPDPRLIPSCVHGDVGVFLREIILATAEFACAYKVNAAFFEALGISGMHLLERVRKLLPSDSYLVWDAKRGDITNTNRHYAKSAFSVWNADAVTVSPYLGFDSLSPFFDYSNRLTFVLCATSEGTELQELETLPDRKPLWLWVAKQAAKRSRGQIGLVVGATHPDRIRAVREVAKDIPLLVPGVGAQGGDIPSQPALVNVSRSILYASADADFDACAHAAAKSFHQRLISAAKEPPHHDHSAHF